MILVIKFHALPPPGSAGPSSPKTPKTPPGPDLLGHLPANKNVPVDPHAEFNLRRELWGRPMAMMLDQSGALDELRAAKGSPVRAGPKAHRAGMFAKTAREKGKAAFGKVRAAIRMGTAEVLKSGKAGLGDAEKLQWEALQARHVMGKTFVGTGPLDISRITAGDWHLSLLEYKDRQRMVDAMRLTDCE